MKGYNRCSLIEYDRLGDVRCDKNNNNKICCGLVRESF